MVADYFNFNLGGLLRGSFCGDGEERGEEGWG